MRRDYSDRFRDPAKNGTDLRPILSRSVRSARSSSCSRPSDREYTHEYNQWLASIPQYIMELVFVVKRFYKPEWGENWREHFSVDIINGTPGNELKCDNRKLVTNFLRVGFDADGSWRTFGLRKDFHPAVKVQMEDDITASVVVPADALETSEPGLRAIPRSSSSRTANTACSSGRTTPSIAATTSRPNLIFAQPDNFFSNYEPLTAADARELIEDAIGFVKFTEPMQRLILDAAKIDGPDYFVSSAHPRLVDGKPTKNPRYLQKRPDLVNPRDAYLAEMAARLHRRIPLDQTGAHAGQRRAAGPPQQSAGTGGAIRSLAVFNPIHYLELPELFMEFICSMTGKSPSTTGAGSEGALTKGPFNALPPIIDLNNALVSFVLTGYDGFITAAGYVGPNVRVDHDISLLIPEVWCRMTPAEREPKFLIANGYLEKCEDFEH